MNTLIPNKSLDSDKDTHTHRCSEWTHATGTACRRAFLDLFMWRGMGRITCVSRDTKQTDILVRMMEKTCMHTVRQTYMYSWHTDRQTDKLTERERERERECVCVREEERVRLASFFLRKHFRTIMNFLRCDLVLFSKFHFFFRSFYFSLCFHLDIGGFGRSL